MAHVVTQACCADASCVFACPVNCIHPTPDEPDFGTAEMLYVDPASCVDCGACVGACPVGAIVPHTKLSDDQLPFLDINDAFPVRSHPPQAPVLPIRPKLDDGRLRVAVVGSGPAAMYVADELLKRPGVGVTVIDRLPTPYGLVRAGVAPDHPETRSITDLFRAIEDQPGFDYALGLDVGTDITHDELLDHHHAVVYATGVSRDRTLGIEGESLPGSMSATEFVAWYNGHPDHVDLQPELGTERAVVVGNGNVALDAARILATDPERLATTDIADHALEALRGSAVREVVLLGRRGPAQAAFTLPELVGLLARDDIEVVAENLQLDEATAARRAAGELDLLTERKLAALESLSTRTHRSGARRIVLRFHAMPAELLGTDHVMGVRVAHTRLVEGEVGDVYAEPAGEHADLSAGLVLRAIGYRGRPIPGVPFDAATATIPNDAGRITDEGAAWPGGYVAGWIKRGPTGFIGTNRTCAQETVDLLVADFNAGLLPSPTGTGEDFTALVRHRRPDVVGLHGWRAIDHEERRRGRVQGRPRRKIVRPEEMLDVASAGRRWWSGRHLLTRRMGDTRVPV
jgi:ferredoxin--NADP+ reductase